MKLRFLEPLAVLVAGMLAAGAAHAQATATWVSGVGDDVNPCSRTAPCKTFTGAIAKTAAGGTLRVLDPGGFGTVTITKSITIEGIPGASHILHQGTTGVVIQAAPSDIVVLRNLAFEGMDHNTAAYGVRVATGGTVIMENVSLQHAGTGVNVDASAGAVRVELHNVNVSGSGIGVRNQSATASVAFQGGILRANGTGVAADAGEILLNGASLLHNASASSQLNGVISSTGDNVIFGSSGYMALRFRRVLTY